MSRSRNIKPSFFLDEELCSLKPLERILFAGLWCLADREGRLELKPKEIKAQILPYDKLDVSKSIDKMNGKFIQVYEVNDKKYIQIINFLKHQKPHKTERKSEIPPPDFPFQHAQNHSMNPLDLPKTYRRVPDEFPTSDSDLPMNSDDLPMNSDEFPEGILAHTDEVPESSRDRSPFLEDFEHKITVKHPLGNGDLTVEQPLTNGYITDSLLLIPYKKKQTKKKASVREVKPDLDFSIFRFPELAESAFRNCVDSFENFKAAVLHLEVRYKDCVLLVENALTWMAAGSSKTKTRSLVTHCQNNLPKMADLIEKGKNTSKPLPAPVQKPLSDLENWCLEFKEEVRQIISQDEYNQWFEKITIRMYDPVEKRILFRLPDLETKNFIEENYTPLFSEYFSMKFNHSLELGFEVDQEPSRMTGNASNFNE